MSRIKDLAGRLDMERWLRDRNVAYRKKSKPGQNLIVFELEHCPFNASHRAPDSSFFLRTDLNRPGFKCHHESCKEHNWQTASAVVGRPESRHYVSDGTVAYGSSSRDVGYVEFDLIPSSELFARQYQLDYLVTGVLAKGQNCVFGGPEKCLKTSIAIDMVMSLGTGTSFLGHFPTRQTRCAIFSGESGEYTIQDTGRRVAESKGLDPKESDVYWCFSLPKIYQPSHLRGLTKMIVDQGVEVVFIDPAYLCLVDERTDANNVFGMGVRLAELRDAVGEATLILIHHARKETQLTGFRKPELADLSHTGFSQFARQWAMVRRRSAYDRTLGIHELYFCVAGSAGHGGDYALDVDEGDPCDIINGRHWAPSIYDLGEWERDKATARVKSNENVVRELQNRLNTVMHGVEEPLSLSRLKTLTGDPEGDLLRAAVAALVEAGVVKPVGNKYLYVPKIL